MNTKAAIILLVFAGWLGGSWYWYACKIKQSCTAKTAVDSQNFDSVTAIVDSIKIEETVGIDSSALMAQGQQSVVETDTMITLRFQSNATHFDEDSLINQALKTLAEKIKVGSIASLKVIGHTDDVGSLEPNLALSIKRANDVKKVLVAMGAKTEAITTEGKGEESPIIKDTTKEARDLNRRVELILNK